MHVQAYRPITSKMVCRKLKGTTTTTEPLYSNMSLQISTSKLMKVPYCIHQTTNNKQKYA